MVAYTAIKASNSLINDATAPSVSVFVGGTSGIGKLTLSALVSTGASLRIYLVGRKSSSERMQLFIQELRTANPNAEIVWIEGEISLLADVKRICNEIKQKEEKIDLLFFSAGYAPMGARKETSEGLEITQSLEYYAKVAFTLHLMPLLEKAEAPRVVAVLAGGMEKVSAINVEDVELKKPGNYTFMKARPQICMLVSIGLDKLASDYPHVTFIHSWPGQVNTGNVWRGIDNPNGWLGWVVWLFLEPLIRLISFSDEEAGQRHLFQCTSAAFGGRGTSWQGKPGLNSLNAQENAVFLVNYKRDCTPNAKVMATLRKDARQKVWDHTLKVLELYM